MVRSMFPWGTWGVQRVEKHSKLQKSSGFWSFVMPVWPMPQNLGKLTRKSVLTKDLTCHLRRAVCYCKTRCITQNDCTLTMEQQNQWVHMHFPHQFRLPLTTTARKTLSWFWVFPTQRLLWPPMNWISHVLGVSLNWKSESVSNSLMLILLECCSHWRDGSSPVKARLQRCMCVHHPHICHPVSCFRHRCPLDF